MKWLKLAGITICLALIGISAHATERRYGPFDAELLRVIDGDTVKANLYIWPGTIQYTSVRLAGIDTPEKSGRNVPVCERALAARATDFTTNFLRNTAIKVKDVHLGTYANRVIGNITNSEGRDLSQALLNAGHARRWVAGDRRPWCED